jgi:hypothetical protein
MSFWGLQKFTRPFKVQFMNTIGHLLAGLLIALAFSLVARDLLGVADPSRGAIFFVLGFSTGRELVQYYHSRSPNLLDRLMDILQFVAGAACIKFFV